jgi:DNA repair exonuclease SbcCD nuclease subunit
MVKILHTADLHLDNGFTTGILPYDIIMERQRDLLETFDKIIETAKKERVELLLVSGDLFEQRYIQSSTIHYVNQRFGELDNTHVFILPGNHDPYHMLHFYKSYQWNKNIFIFTDEYEKVNLKDLDVAVHGIGFGYQEESRALLENLNINPSRKINILMLHGSDMTLAPRKQSKYIPFNHSDLAHSGFDYIALGHYHQHKKFNDIYGKVIAAYPGSPEPLGFDELGKHGIIIGEITKEKNTISILPISNRQYYSLDVDITNAVNIQEIKKKVIKEIAPYCPEINLFSIRLTGYYSWELGLSIDFFERQFKDIAYYIQIEDNTKPNYDIDKLIYGDTLLSSYILEIHNKLQIEKDEKQIKILKKAMEIGTKVLRGEV